MWHLPPDTWHVTNGGGGCEHSLKVPAPQLLWFGMDSVLKIWTKGSLNEPGTEVIVEPPGYTGSVNYLVSFEEGFLIKNL